MKHILLILLGLTQIIILSAQAANEKYDKKLADSLGADAYGMKSYVFVILKTGPNKESNKVLVIRQFLSWLYIDGKS